MPSKLLIADYGRQVKLSVKYRPDEPNPTTLQMFGPTDLSYNKCVGTVRDNIKQIKNPSEMKQVIPQSGSVSIDCKRSSIPKNVDGVKLECTQEEIFNIVTSGQEASLKIPSVCRESLAATRYTELRKALDDIDVWKKETVDPKLKALEDANKTKLKLFWKGRNNGLATCGQFCRNATTWPTPEGPGTCVAAKIVKDGAFRGIGQFPRKLDDPWNCDQVLDGSGSSDVLCLCANLI